jgi:O-antigen ligase
LAVSFALYTLSILSSMAGMEIFGWLSAILVLALVATKQLRFPPLLGGDWALLALLAVVVVGAFVNTPEPKNTLDIVGLFRFVPLFLLLRAGLIYLWSETRWRTWLMGLSLAAGVIAIYAMSQYFTGLDILRGDSHRAVQVFITDSMGEPRFFRASGLMSAPITYANSVGLLVCFPFAFSMVQGAVADRRWRWLMGLCTLLILGGIVASMSRGVWVAMAAAFLIMAFYLGRRYAWTMLISGVVVITASLILSPTLHDRLLSIVSSKTASAVDRERIWSANLAMVKDYPILGVGYGENERLIGDYYQRLGVDGQIGHAHNTFVQFLAGTGIVGFVLFMFFAVFYLYLCHQLWYSIPANRPWLRAFVLGALGAQVVLHVGGLTECNFKDMEVNHEIMLILAGVGVVNQVIKGKQYGINAAS